MSKQEEYMNSFDFSAEIASFVSEKIGGIVIVQKNTGKVVYADPRACALSPGLGLGSDAAQTCPWMKAAPILTREVTDWEAATEDHFLLLHGMEFEKGGEAFLIFRITDDTQYVKLNREVISYMSFLKELSAFQGDALSNLAASPYELLLLVQDYVQAECVYIALKRGDYLEVLSVDGAKHYFNSRFPYEGTLQLPREVAQGKSLTLFVNGAVEDIAYAIFLEGEAKGEEELPPVIQSVLGLCMENSIMRGKLQYNSEHDMLTGLCNKGKYLSMVEKNYQNRESIAIFNFDVNNLKKMNDTYGHEAGDRLIIKAADSIRQVISEKVQGYRMGGDEFLMVATDITEAEAMSLLKKWEESLAAVNREDGSILCVMAVGMVYAKGTYDFEELAQKADQLMYEDKLRKKTQDKA